MFEVIQPKAINPSLSFLLRKSPRVTGKHMGEDLNKKRTLEESLEMYKKAQDIRW